MFSLRNADTQSANVQSLTSKDSNETATDTLFLQIPLLFKFKIIKPEKMKIYKSQTKTNINNDSETQKSRR